MGFSLWRQRGAKLTSRDKASGQTSCLIHVRSCLGGHLDAIFAVFPPFPPNHMSDVGIVSTKHRYNVNLIGTGIINRFLYCTDMKSAQRTI